jgi:hypothetical protein
MAGRSLAAAGVLAAIALASTVPQDPSPPVKRFSHAQHVGPIWTNLEEPEVWRDCRGCHRFDAGNDVSAPQQVCAACHFPALQGARFAKGWDRDLGLHRTRTRQAFRHHTHAQLECRECHLPGGNVEFVNDFDIVTGPGQCARCHDEQQLAAGDFAQIKTMRWLSPAGVAAERERLRIDFPAPPQGDAAIRAYAQKLVAALAGPNGGLNTRPLQPGGTFDHYDHGDIACVDCHANIPTASALEVGTGRIPAAGCASCHQKDAEKRPVAQAPAGKAEVRPLWSLGAFVHADHYRVAKGGAPRTPRIATEAGYAKLATTDPATCAHCHREDVSARGVPKQDFPFAIGRSESFYADCADCHAVPGWTTGETAAKPLHDSTDGAVDARSGWNECARCHVFGDAKFASTRPTDEVTRASGRVFRFRGATHPDITTKGVDAAGRPALADCATCHRARVPELPSRIERRPFRHASHLPAEPTQQDCRKCHEQVAAAATPQALADEALRTYSLASCGSCHLGDPVVEEPATTVPAPRAVVRFPHAPHVGKADCTACHELATDGGDVLTTAGAASCAQCHDHRAATEGPATERLFDGEVKSCAQCHREDRADPARAATAAASSGAAEPALSLPPLRGSAAAATDPRYRAEQTVFGGFLDSQFHPAGQRCTDCHKALPVEPGSDSRMAGVKLPRAQDHVFASKVSPHVLAGQTGKQPSNCLACHWTPMDRLRFGVDTADQDLREQRAKPSSKPSRARFGNDAKDYPGEKSNG